MRTRSLSAAILLICGAALAGASDGWKELRDKNIKRGFPPERVDQILTACEKSEFSVPQTAALFEPAYAARQERLPSECVLSRIEEGLAKHIVAADIVTAATRRLEYLRRADKLVMSIRQGRGREHGHLITHTCMALESGLPESVLAEVFNRPVRFRYGRLIHVVEAGETMQLAGLTPKQTQLIMNDCIDRDLNGIEVSRATDYVLAERRAGKDFAAIHKTLWVRSD